MRCGEAGDAERDPASRRPIDGARLHGQRDALARDVHLLDAHLDHVAGLHHLARVLDEAVGQLGDVHQAVLVHADVDEGAERGDVGHHAFELHAGLQVGDLLDALLEGGGLELGARIAAGLLQLGEDVGDGRDAERGVGELRPGLQRLQERRGRR